MSEHLRNQNRSGLTALTVVLIFSLLIGNLSVAQAQSDAPALFGDVGAMRPAVERPLSPEVARARYVNVNIGMLFSDTGKPLNKNLLPRVTLNLFSDVTYTGIVTRVQKDEWGISWTGRLQGKPNSYFYLVVTDNVFIAHVASPEGIYEVSWAGDDLYQAVQIDQSKFVDEDPAATYAAPGRILSPSELDPNADSGSFIDILVAYTDDARIAEGSTAAMKARIALAMTETNRAYARSGALTRLRLVHIEEYPYVETGNLNTDLTRFRGSADGFFDSVHSLRNVYGADMVALIVETGGSLCGLASAIMANATTAFQATVRSCATGNYTFGHEFGHLQGARHDPFADPTNTPFPYCHGWVHPFTTVPAERVRTIMATDAQCQSFGYTCTRLQNFSNPHNDMGVIGVSENHRCISETAFTVANFRSSLIDANFFSDFNSSDENWSSINGAWAIAGGASYRSLGRPNLFASASHAGNFGDSTYEVRMKRTGTCTSCANHISIRGLPFPLDASKRWNKEYKFAYTNAGSFSVWRVNGASVVALQPWTASGAIVVNNWNTLKVVAVGASLRFYINNVLVWSGSDTSFKTGKVGIAISRDASAATLDVDWARLTNTPTADFNPNETVAPGVELLGGNDKKSP